MQPTTVATTQASCDLDRGLWSVDASADAAVCADVAARLGGRVHEAAATAH